MRLRDRVHQLQRDGDQTIQRTEWEKYLREDERTFQGMGAEIDRLVLGETLRTVPQWGDVWCRCENIGTVLWKTNIEDDYRSGEDRDPARREFAEFKG